MQEGDRNLLHATVMYGHVEIARMLVHEFGHVVDKTDEARKDFVLLLLSSRNETMPSWP